MLKKVGTLFMAQGTLQTASIFVALAVIFGVFFAATTPLLWGSDETFHIARIYQLSEGHVFAKKQAHDRRQSGYGGQVPTSIYVAMAAVVHDLQVNDAKGSEIGIHNVDDPQIYTAIGQQKLKGDGKVVYGFPNTAAYSPIAYSPSILGMRIARSLNMSLHGTVMLLRLVNLACYIGIIYAALRILSKTKARWLVFVAALLPMSIYEAAIITADGLTIAVAFLLSSILIKAWLGDRLNRAEVTALMASLIALPVLKPGYIPLIFLGLLVPFKAVAQTRAKAYIMLGSSVFIGTLLFLGWAFLTRDIANSAALIRPQSDWVLVDPARQVHFIIGHPIAYLAAIGRIALLEDNKNITELLGTLGFNRVMLPGLAYVLSVAALFLASWHIETLKQKVWITYAVVGAVLASVLIIITGMYVTYTPLAAPLISGIQGRYFLPLVPLGLYSLSVLFKRSDNANKHITESIQIPLLMLACVAVSLITTAVKYYYVTWG